MLGAHAFAQLVQGDGIERARRGVDAERASLTMTKATIAASMTAAG